MKNNNNNNINTRNNDKDTQRHQTPGVKPTEIPCYSAAFPPERGLKVSVQCNRVDAHGVWGSLNGWGSNCTAYMPIGFVVPQRGRGERRAQADFLTRAKRQAAKGKPMSVVAVVESVEVHSSKGVDEIFTTAEGHQVCDTFLITVTRRGLEKSDEKKTLEALKKTQLSAARLVDKAAEEAGVAANWAREKCLYRPYQQCLRKVSADRKKSPLEDDGTTQDPLTAAYNILVTKIGALVQPNEEAVLDILGCAGDFDSIERDFALALWKLCREERLRTTKPVTYTLAGSVGGVQQLSDVIGKEKLNTSIEAGNLSCIQEAISTLIAEPPPEGCCALKITAEGAGKYLLKTKSTPENAQQANTFLEAALSKMQRLYAVQAKAEKRNQQKATSNVEAVDRNMDNLQPTLNIGLIGDVANGKSTLIRAISGKRTQAHSTEQQKHGMTIRLGFANASILRCLTDGQCGLYCFRQDEVTPASSMSSPQCPFCQGSATLVTRVSFIDCPGHAELLATMLAGASAFDAVIFAAAANVPCPTPQARQHLSALLASNNGSIPIAIAQTKAELIVNQPHREVGYSACEILALHAESARERLSDTVAAGAPFFPICAPMGLGLEPLAKWLANLVDQRQANTALAEHASFGVLRSFDVNHAGKDATELVGGVLGGNIRGTGAVFRQGDLLELRPGIVLGKDKDKDGQAKFQVHPLQFQIHQIMTDTSPIPEARAGGLVALQTNLCPSLCADDLLAGSIVGHVGTLPPILGPQLLLDTLTFVQLNQESSKSPEKALKKGTKVRCHFGPASVAGEVVRVSSKRKKVELNVNRPICAFLGDLVAIEAKPAGSHSFMLVGHATLTDGSICLEGSGSGDGMACDAISSSESGTVISGRKPANTYSHHDAESEEAIRERFLEDLAEKQDADNGSCGRELISVPSPVVSRDGGSHVLIENFAVIAMTLNRDPPHFQAYLVREAGLSSCARAGENGQALRVRYKARGFSELIRRVIRRYVVQYVTCQECRSAKTEFLKAGAGASHNHHKTVELSCRQCCARRFVPAL